MLRTFVIIGILAGCAFMANWFTIDRSGTETTIRFNRGEIREDASRVLAKGRELLNQEGGSRSDQGLLGQPQSGQQDGFADLRNVITDTIENQSEYIPQQATLPKQPWE